MPEMSGPERCVNPNCTEFGTIQDGPCTPWPTARNPEDLRAQFYGNQTGAWINGLLTMHCLTCGAIVGSQDRHIEWHLGEKAKEVIASLSGEAKLVKREALDKALHSVLLGYIGNCTCHRAYSERELRDPSCLYCQVNYEELHKELAEFVEGKLRGPV